MDREMSEFSFVERANYETGFSHIFTTQIAPALQELERERLAINHRTGKWIEIILAVTVALSVATAIYVHIALAIFPLFWGCAIAFLVYMSKGGKFEDRLSDLAAPIICDFLADLTYIRKPKPGFHPTKLLRDLRVIPPHDNARFEDSVEGNWRNVRYRSVQASFSDTYRDSSGYRKTRTIFNGLLIAVACPIEMPKIIFLADHGNFLNILNKWATSGSENLKRLKLPDKESEELYEVYTDDPKCAETLLGTDFGQKLNDLSRNKDGSTRRMTAAFEGRWFYMGIDLDHDFMNFSSIDQPLSRFDEKIHSAFDDLILPRTIIDGLLALPERQAQKPFTPAASRVN